MKNLWLIIQREYLTRVRKRSFILATLLTPLAFALFFMVVGFIFSYESGEETKVAVIDEGNYLDGSNLPTPEGSKIYFTKSQKSLEELREDVLEGKYNGILRLPAIPNPQTKKLTVYYYADKALDLDVEMNIEKRISQRIRKYKIEAMGLDENQLSSLETNIDIEPEPLEEGGEDASSLTAVIGAGIGGLMGFIMYIAVFIYGMMVMRSVMEEKVNRIVEVMISSVKPFQLMLGKIIGVGGVGLTQVAVWMILIPSLYLLVMLIFGFDAEAMQASSSMEGVPQMDPDDMEMMLQQITLELSRINWWAIIPLFIIYFLGGYFMYASLFAAVGSAMGDDLGEGQALTIPITIPVILALYIMMVVVRNPQSSLAVWASIFPLFSPIVMPARLAFNPPVWEIITSIVVLIATCIFFVWLSGRIYRVGILMYGKKVSFKELGKWMFYKG